MTPTTPPRNEFEVVTGTIPAEFLQSADDFFESGYEADEEEEYP